MRTHFSFHNSKTMAVLTVAVSAMVTLPVLLLPVGFGSNAPAYVIVDRAYAAAYPEDADKKAVLVEQWALSGALTSSGSVDGLEDGGSGAEATPSPTAGASSGDSSGASDDGMITIGEGQTVSATYIDGSAPEATDKYAGILTATIVQHNDDGDRPVEILDPSTFLSDNTTVYIKTTNTIIKETPDMSSVTLASINKGKAATRIGIGDTWAKIRTEEGIEGFVPQDNLSESMIFIAIDRTVWVDTDGLKLRSEPSTESSIIKTLSKNTPLHCSAIADNWYKVTTSDGTEGYVYVAYTTRTAPATPVPTKKPTTKTTTKTTTKKSSSSGNTASLPKITGVNGESIVNICISMLGVQYEWAGESRDGVDCSGLVVYAYRQIGISLPHQSNSLVKCGVGVSRSDIKAGDIICWDIRGSSDTVEHVGIYVGGGSVIHASSTRDRVEYGSLDMYPIVSIRRIIQ